MADNSFSQQKPESDPVDTNIRFEFERQNNILMVHLSGEADLVGSSKLKQAIRPQLSGVNRVIFDLSNLEFADSYFLRFLIKLRKHLGSVSSVKVINVNSNVARIFDITGLNKLFM